jgi:hypothetical protein
MSLHLLEVIVSNAVGDLDDSCVNEMTLLSTNPTKATSESSSKSYSKKRKQEPQIQNSHASGLEKAAVSPKKRKTSSTPTASKGMTPETASYVTPLCIKIAALETLEILLNVVCPKFIFLFTCILFSILLLLLFLLFFPLCISRYPREPKSLSSAILFLAGFGKFIVHTLKSKLLLIPT